MIAKDEEVNLTRCLASVKDAVDEIIIVDTGSTDLTTQVAKDAGAIVVSFLWQDDFSAARNASLELATGDWILFLDADEALEPESVQILRQVVEGEEEGYFLKIINLIGSEGSIETSPDLVFRLFRNKPVYRFRGAIHEQIVDVILENNNQARFQIAEGVAIWHYGYLNQQIIEKDKKNRNLTIIKKELDNAPDNHMLRYHYGIELYRSDRFAEAAEELIKAANNTDPKTVYYPKLLRYIALAHYSAQKYDWALEAINLALQFFPDYADLYYYGGLIYLEQKNYAAAYEWFYRAISMPEQPAYYAPFSGSRGFRAYYQLGQLAETFGNEEDALRFYLLSLRDNSEFTIALYAVVRLLNPRSNPEYTKESMEKLCDFCTPESQRLIGTVYFTEGAYRLAYEYLEKIAASSLDAYTSILKAICLIQQKRTIEALYLLEEITPGQPYFPLAMLNKILCFWFENNRTKVRELCDEFLAMGLSSDTGAVVAMLKDSLYKQNSQPPAILAAEGIALIKDILIRTLDLGCVPLAESLLARLDKHCLQQNALELARIFNHFDQLALALTYTEAALEENANSAGAWCQMAEIVAKQARREEACLCYRRALSIEPCQPQYYVKLIKLLKLMRQELLAEAAVKYPNIPIFHQLLEEEKNL